MSDTHPQAAVVDLSHGPCEVATVAGERCSSVAEYTICKDDDAETGLRACVYHVVPTLRAQVRGQAQPTIPLSVYVLVAGRLRA